MKNTPQPSTQEYFKGLVNLVGTPYSVANCWELAVLFYDRVFGISLYHIYSGPIPEDRKDKKNLIYTNMGEFEEVTIPEFGDIVLIKLFGVESHIGVFVGSGMFMHTTRNTGCVMDRVDKWKKMIVGYYRVKRND